MNDIKISKIMMILFAVVLCFGPVGLAGPIGTAFTYQGRLIDSNNAADGLYDFQFKLYDANGGGNKLGQDVNMPEIDVIDGYFTAELDFGSAFDGNNRWLEIGVRPGIQSDPNAYSLLSPRQKVTPTPYALHARSVSAPLVLTAAGTPGTAILSVGSTGDGVAIGAQSSGGDIAVLGKNGTAIWGISTTGWAGYFDGKGYFSGNVGIGTDTPGAKLDVAGPIKITDGSQGNGKVLTCDGTTGLATWQTLPAGGDITSVTAGTGLSGGGTSGDVTLSVAVPLVLSSFGNTIFGTTTGTYGAKAVYGLANNTSANNYGGYFEAAGLQGVGVEGHATNTGNYQNTGGFFQASGTTGMGVQGLANNTGNYVNFGGYFRADGVQGIGVQGYASGSSGKGVVGYGGTAGTSYDFDATGPGVNYGTTSSIRWKRDIEAIDKPLEKIMQLRGVYFTWDAAHGGHHDIGMIAEEVGKVLPEIVVYEENGIDADGMDYSMTTPLLVEAVKALKTQVDDLRKENQDLRSRLDTLENLTKGAK